MRRYQWLVLGLLALAPGLGAAPAPGSGEAYKTLGQMAVQQQGRRKPFDTLARESIKQIHGYSSVRLYGPDGKRSATWPAVAAVLDWAARPSYWDDQEIILVQYLPLKQALLNEAAKDLLRSVASAKTTPAADRVALKLIADGTEPSSADLASASKRVGLDKADRDRLAAMSRKMSADQKWLAPADIEGAVVPIDGKPLAFQDWLGSISTKNRAIRMATMSGRSKKSAPVASLSNLEQKALEVGERLYHYRALRDKDTGPMEGLDVDVEPRPVDKAYLAFTRDALLKDPERVIEIFPIENIDASSKDLLRKATEAAPAPLEANAIEAFETYIDEVKKKERYLPGTNEAADARFLSWLKEKASWVPLRFFLTLDPKELGRAGYDVARVSAFRAAYNALEAAEKEHPGEVAADKASAVVVAARQLGTAANPTYPSESSLSVETHYNRAAPFYWAPFPYGLALLLLVLTLGITTDRRSKVSTFGRGLYVLGVASLISGILLEIYGFSLRVRISGWAPVTNMYETVIWVALVTAVIGLALELIYRKAFAALAASGVSLLATVLAANVSEQLLDPRIKSLTPVLRSNYWLTIHVLTIVSSYAAFALAMGLGLLATGYYLAATYRRSARFSELAAPLAPGLVLLIPGAIGVYYSLSPTGPAWLASQAAYLVVCAVAGLGGIFVITGSFAAIGEAANRHPATTSVAGLLVLVLGSVGILGGAFGVGSSSLLVLGVVVASLGAVVSVLGLFGATCRVPVAAETVAQETEFRGSSHASVPATASYASAGGDGGGVATLTRPTVAEIRARSVSMPPKLDERGRSMQETAARIKPISNFIYRAMQVGVLLVAAGTILGGVWADYSWGRFWGWDPKEVWALITLLVYLVPLHGRFAGWVNTFGMVASSVICFASVLMAWYGVNFVLGVGLHSYGFSEGGGQGVVLSATMAVFAVVLGAYWRRWLSQNRTLAA